MAINVLACVGAHTIGTGWTMEENIASAARLSVGTYQVVLAAARSSSPGGIVLVNTDQLLFAWGAFTDPTHITVVFRNASGVLTDLLVGAFVTLVAWQ